MQNDPFNEMKVGTDRKTIVVIKEVLTPEENTRNDTEATNIDHEMLINDGEFQWVSI